MAAILSALLAGTTPLAGQWRAEPNLPVDRVPSVAADPPAIRLAESLRSQPANDLTLALAGIAGAAVGTLGGAYMGYQLDREHFHWDCKNGCEDPGLPGMLGGWSVGSALTTPLSVHLANGGRGSLSSAYLSSALIAGAGVAGLLVVGSPVGGFVLLGVPVAQVISAVLIERRVAQ